MIQTIKRLALPLIMILALAVLTSEAIAATPNASQKPHPVTGIGPAILVDSTGKQIGPFDWADRGLGVVPTVLLKINGLWLAVRVVARGFRDEGGTLDYTTTDCSGTAYNKILDFPVVGPTFIAAGILHYADPRIAQNLQFASRQSVDADGILGGCGGISDNGPASPDQIFNLSTLGFVPPFTVSVRGVK
jgi:hypothetical protein